MSFYGQAVKKGLPHAFFVQAEEDNKYNQRAKKKKKNKFKLLFGQ